MALDDSSFRANAAKTLEKFRDAIEEAAGDRLEVDLAEGVLTIESETGAVWVINQHGPSRQLWLSSPVSGASHFGYDASDGGWRSTRGGAGLSVLLAGELAAAAGGRFELS